MSRSLIRYTAACAVLGLGAVACDETPVTLPAETSVVAATDSVTLYAGEETNLSAQVLDQAGRALSGAVVGWHSTAPLIASVTSDGEVSGEAPGVANVIASYGGLADTVVVTVVPDDRDRVVSLEFIGESGTYSLYGPNPVLHFRAFNGYGEVECLFGEYTFHTSDASVVELDGLSDPCGAIELELEGPGQATVTLSIHGVGDSFNVTVTSVGAVAFFDETPVGNAKAGDTVTYVVKVINETGAPLEGEVINFDVQVGSLLATSVATDEDGRATARWIMPTNLRDLGEDNYGIVFETHLSNGEIYDDDASIFVGVAEAESLKLFLYDEAKAVWVETSADTLRFDTGVPQWILVNSYDRFGNLVDTDGTFAAAPVDVIVDTDDDTVTEGQLSSSSPYVELESATEEITTLTAEVTTAEGETLEAEVVLVFVDPTP